MNAGFRKLSKIELGVFFDMIPGMVWCSAPDGAVELQNRRWLDYTGLSTEQSSGWGWTVAIHPEDLPRLMDRWRALLTAGNSGEIEGRLRRFDGEYRWFLFRVTPLHDERGKILKWYGVNTDIEDRKRIENALRRSEAYLAEAERLSHTGSWAYDIATRVPVYWSLERCRISKFDPAKGHPTVKEYQALHAPEDWSRLMEAFDKAIQEKTDFETDSREVLPDGTVKYLHIVGHPVRNAAGNVVELVGSTIDMTEHKRTEEALHKAQAHLTQVTHLTMMGELAASIAHEVNQPLAAVVTNANACLRWLDRESPNLTEAREAIQRIIRDGSRGGDVIARIRALLKKQPPASSRINVNSVIQEIIALAQANLRGITIKTALAKSLPEVFADRVQLQQVLLNLFLNAIEVMKTVTDRPRILRIQTQLHDGGGVLVAVEDSGPGVDAAHIEHLFEPFYTTKPDGLGMGLSISRSIIESHGGRLWVETNRNSGAKFQFTLPVENET